MTVSAATTTGGTPRRRAAGGNGRARRPAGGLDPVLLFELRAALAAGVAPGPALVGAAPDSVLAPLAATVRLGRGLADAAATVDTGDPAADLLVRALGVAERTGTGALAAVEQAVAAVRAEAALARQLAVRTAQARGTAVVLGVVPLVAWALLVAVEPGALRFYATAPGAATAAATLLLAGAGQWWSHRLVRAAARAGEAADPLVPRPSRPDLGRVLVTAGPALVVTGLLVGAVAGLAAAAVTAALATRWHPAPSPVGDDRDGDDRAGDGESAPGRRGRSARAAGGAAESVELVAFALTAGLPTTAAVAAVAPLAPPAARPVLAAAARRLGGGWTADAAFAGTGLAQLGAVLSAADRWGAPAEDALRRLAADLRADRAAASEAAAERVQLALVFPTTLLTLPAFLLGVVPPFLWVSFAG